MAMVIILILATGPVWTFPLLSLSSAFLDLLYVQFIRFLSFLLIFVAWLLLKNKWKTQIPIIERAVDQNAEDGIGWAVDVLVRRAIRHNRFVKRLLQLILKRFSKRTLYFLCCATIPLRTDWDWLSATMHSARDGALCRAYQPVVTCLSSSVLSSSVPSSVLSLLLLPTSLKRALLWKGTPSVTKGLNDD